MSDEFNQLTDDEGHALNSRPQRQKPTPIEENGVEVPWEQLDPETLVQLIKGFILREGTDYGVHEAQLTSKIEQIQNQLKRGEVKFVFDLTTETGSFVSKKR